jgi:hypothetical protein
MKRNIAALLVCFTLIASSCRHEYELIFLMNKADTALLFTSPGWRTVPVGGGDGGRGIMSVVSDSPGIVDARRNSAGIDIEVLWHGNASVAVSDNRTTIYIRVRCDFNAVNMVNTGRTVLVEGDLRRKEIDEITEDAVKTTLAGKNGGYTFAFKDGAANGTVTVYRDKFGENGVTGAFERKVLPFDDAGGQIIVFYLDVHHEKRTLLYGRLDRLLSGMYFSAGTYAAEDPNPFVFAEDVTGRYKDKYPEVERVYTLQRLNITASE